MKNTLISVVIPARNAQDTIVAAISSALTQTHTHLEVLVVDDGSTDSTLDLVDKVADNRVCRIQRDDSIRGVSAARNLGIRAAKGDYIAFLDADDLWLPHKLETQLLALERHLKAAAAYGQTDRLMADGSRMAHTRECPSGDLSKLLRERNLIGNGSNLLVSRQIALATGGFPEELDQAEDWVFTVRVATRTQFAGVDDVLSLYRDTAGSASLQFGKMASGYRCAQQLISNEMGGYSGFAKRAGRAHHYRYLARLAEERGLTRKDSLFGAGLLMKAWLCALGNSDVQASAGLSFTNVRRGFRRILRKERYWRATANTYRNNGYIEDTFELADTSVVPGLLEEATLFDEALERLQKTGFPRRVPYFITPLICRVAQDQNILRLVHRLLPSNDAWVMWGANIRREIPNAADHWHVDTESFRWGGITLVVALDGCTPASATWYLSGSHRPRVWPPEAVAARDTDTLNAIASKRGIANGKVGSFKHFANGRFYAFDAGGWHCGDPDASTSRVLLFLHYHSAREPRIPAMDDYAENSWLTEPAAYLCQPGKEEQLNPQLASAEKSLPVLRGYRGNFTSRLRRRIANRLRQPIDRPPS